jgi:hypothetical protein
MCGVPTGKMLFINALHQGQLAQLLNVIRLILDMKKDTISDVLHFALLSGTA